MIDSMRTCTVNPAILITGVVEGCSSLRNSTIPLPSNPRFTISDLSCRVEISNMSQFAFTVYEAGPNFTSCI